MSLKDWIPDKTFLIGSIAVSVVLGYIGEVPWWTMWLFWFVGFPFMLWIFGWIFGHHTLTGKPKWKGFWRP